jgi:beta-glucanase (GH16 family)
MNSNGLLLAIFWSALSFVSNVKGETGTSQPTADSEDYHLVWADEFTKSGPLDAADWTFERGFVRNQELQWYQPENAMCSDGHLVIEARREEVSNPRYDASSKQWKESRQTAHYTSASASTRGHHAWLYGRFEMRGRIDISLGSWPAFWTLGTSGRWPECGEVDIMEFYRNMLLANIGWAGERRNIQWNSVRRPMASFHDAEWSKKFHVWRMDWDENRMAIYVDDELINSQDLSKTLNAQRAGDNPFHHPMYLILNQAIGGEQGVDPSKTAFPLRFEVDYVRVYQTPAEIEGQVAEEKRAGH